MFRRPLASSRAYRCGREGETATPGAMSIREIGAYQAQDIHLLCNPICMYSFKSLAVIKRRALRRDPEVRKSILFKGLQSYGIQDNSILDNAVEGMMRISMSATAGSDGYVLPVKLTRKDLERTG